MEGAAVPLHTRSRVGFTLLTTVYTVRKSTTHPVLGSFMNEDNLWILERIRGPFGALSSLAGHLDAQSLPELLKHLSFLPSDAKCRALMGLVATKAKVLDQHAGLLEEVGDRRIDDDWVPRPYLLLPLPFHSY